CGTWSLFMLDWSEPLSAPVRPRLSPAVATANRTARVASVATELPVGRLVNAKLAAALGVSDEWIVSRTGIRERRRARADERLADYAARAGAAALFAAGV